jgi:hypothetical protein
MKTLILAASLVLAASTAHAADGSFDCTEGMRSVMADSSVASAYLDEMGYGFSDPTHRQTLIDAGTRLAADVDADEAAYIQAGCRNVGVVRGYALSSRLTISTAFQILHHEMPPSIQAALNQAKQNDARERAASKCQEMRNTVFASAKEAAAARARCS